MLLLCFFFGGLKEQDSRRIFSFALQITMILQKQMCRNRSQWQIICASEVFNAFNVGLGSLGPQRRGFNSRLPQL